MATNKRSREAAQRVKTRERATRIEQSAPRNRAKAAKAIPDNTAKDAKLPLAVVYIHGIGQQDPPAIAKANWDTALFGQSMSDTAMAYWADIRHPPPQDNVRTRALAREDGALSGDDAQQFMTRLQRRIDSRVRVTLPAGANRTAVFSGLFAGIGDALFGWLSKGFVKDTAAYFFDPVQRKAMQQRLIDVLDASADRSIVLVAHSQGTLIAYDVLRLLNGRTPSGSKLDVALFVTLGSPLGIDEIQRKLTQPLLVPSGVRAWANFADPFDPVALDKGLKGEFKGDIEIHDTLVHNPAFGNPHSAVGYLSTTQVRSCVYPVLSLNQLNYGSRVRKDVLADIVQTIAAREFGDDSVPEQRHPVLFELRDAAGFGAAAHAGLQPGIELESLAAHRTRLVRFLDDNVADRKAACIDPLQRFVAARLTPFEIQRAETGCMTSVYCIWKNTRKRAFIDRSGDVVQVTAARIAYRAEGDGITWAVLDTGVESAHPHFAAHDNIVKVWDCTHPGPVRPLLKGRTPSTDSEGHGTHVCGIIAGEHGDHHGMAIKTKLHVYKVLDDAGSGDDSWIIKAIDHIALTNHDSAELAIHGVNLSLGGSFNPEVYGCGHSPICQELGRLWRQGIVVCVACGNEGALDVSTPDGTQMLNFLESIGDPANLDDCLAVGSVHTDRPHTYGVSYFSSRGPTADGRGKPDVVAPGERISSCNARFKKKDESSYYVALSGTSMAAPHVSGLAAAFLSVRREFVGRPDDVKKILLANCTDLDRDKYVQGAGLPNLVKMLANT
ncbi:MAG: S8 family peptidase [Rudaea sp.]